MNLRLITFKDECEWTHCFSQQYANHCLQDEFQFLMHITIQAVSPPKAHQTTDES